MGRLDPEGEALVIERSRPGWFRFSGLARPAHVLVRGTVDERGRVVVAELLLADASLDVAVLRTIPLGRITRALNLPHRRQWVLEGDQGASPYLQDLVEATHDPEPVRLRNPELGRLQRPPQGRGGGGDDFYRHVADVYRHYAQISPRPAVEMAKRADVPPATARRWIEQARVRGLLEREGRKST